MASPVETRLNLPLALVALLIAGVLLSVLSMVYNALMLFGMSLVVAYILLGPVSLLEKAIQAFSLQVHRLRGAHGLLSRSPKINPRILAITLVYFLFLSGSMAALNGLGPSLLQELRAFKQDLPQYLLQAENSLIEWSDKTLGPLPLQHLFADEIQQARDDGLLSDEQVTAHISAAEKQVIQDSVFQRAVEQWSQWSKQALTTAITQSGSLLFGTVNGVLYLIAGILAVFYGLLDGARLRQSLLRRLPTETSRQTLSYLLENFHGIMLAFVKGQVLLGILTGIYMTIVYTVFKVKYALLLGVLFAVAEFLPVVGTWIGIGIGLTVIILTQGPWVALYVWLCSYGYQTIKDNILAPKVVGDVMGLHPTVVIVALMLCAKVAGLFGVLLALPLASMAHVALRYFLSHSNLLESQLLENPRT